VKEAAMNPDQPKAETLFARAIGIESAADRAAFLEQACGSDAALRREVEKLVRDYFRAGGFLEKPAVAGLATVDESPTGERIGAMIGPYKLVQEIGEGGMGTVYMAQQQEPVKRVVALKVVKPGMDSRQVIARFDAERQALALMDHPNIARVLDAGTTATGRPYFVMELVKGVAITRYCDEHRLTPRQRLELFVPVCQAIQHAHQKGIIHRDIKPGNVLVSSYDGKPVPKVIDFGIAKATGQQLTDGTLLTGFGMIVGTLEYMSPEQAMLNALDIDTRSDVYSLGILLYELLTGSTPLSRKRLKEAAVVEVLRLIREEEPQKPSTRLSTTDELPSVAANRGLEPKKLSGLVRGELDWIVMKALEKDRDRRYESANGFALDIQRYLADEPVQACPPSAWYRFNKFARRNRAAITTAGLVCVALVTTSTVLAVSNVRIKQEKEEKAKAFEQASEQRELARHNLDEALRVVDRLLTRVATDRLAGLPHVEPLKQSLLEDALAFYLGFLAENRDKPALALETGLAYLRTGTIQDQLGKHVTAKQTLEQGITLFEELARNQPEEARYRQELARSYYAKGHVLQTIGPPRDAEQAYRRALGLYEELVAENPTNSSARDNLAGSHNQLGLVLVATGRLREAEKEYRLAATLGEQLVADTPTNQEHRTSLAKYYLNLSALLDNIDQLPEAEDYARKSLAAAEQVVRAAPRDRDHETDVAISRLNVARVLMDRGRLDDARRESGKGIAMLQKLVDDFPTRPDYRHRLSEGHGNLGITYWHGRRLQESEESFNQACKLHEKLAADFPSVAAYQSDCGATFSNLGILLQSQGKHERARGFFEEAIRRQDAAAKLNPKNPMYRQFLGKHYINLAAILKELGTAGEARVHQQAIDIARGLVADFPDVPVHQNLLAGALNNLSSLRRTQGKPDEGLRLLEEAIRCQQKAVDGNPSSVLYLQTLDQYRSHLSPLLEQLGRPAEAEEALRRRVDVLEKLTSLQPQAAGHQSNCGAILHNLALKHLDRQELEQATQLLGQAIVHQQAALRQKPAEATFRQFLGNHYTSLGYALAERKQYAEAEKSYRSCLDIREKLAADHPTDQEFQADVAAVKDALEKLAALTKQ
jgi:serine/threonine protein kinase